jgi:hypothetical protein
MARKFEKFRENKSIPKTFLTAPEAAMLYGFSPGTLANFRSRKEGPKYFKAKGKVLYKISDFELWITSNPMLTKDSI